MELLKIVQKEAMEIIREDPDLNGDKYSKIKHNIQNMFYNSHDSVILN